MLESGLNIAFKHIFLEFPLDHCPVILLPFLFDKEEDIHFDKLLVDSSVLSIMSSTSGSGGQKLSGNMPMVDLFRELGYSSCSRYCFKKI